MSTTESGIRCPHCNEALVTNGGRYACRPCGRILNDSELLAAAMERLAVRRMKKSNARR